MEKTPENMMMEEVRDRTERLGRLVDSEAGKAELFLAITDIKSALSQLRTASVDRFVRR